MADVLLEKLVIEGINVMPFNPPGSSLKAVPVRATEDVTLLNGRMVTRQAAQIGAWDISLDAGETFVVPLEVKQAVEARYAAGEPVRLTETLSDPTQERAWAGRLRAAPIFDEVAGSGRQLFTYQLNLRQEG